MDQPIELNRYTYIFFDAANTLLYKPDLYERIAVSLAAYNFDLNSSKIELTHRILTEVIDFPVKTTKDFYLEFNSRLLSALGVLPETDLTELIYQNCKGLEWSAFDDVDALKLIDRPIGVLSNWDGTLQQTLDNCLDISFFKIISSHMVGSSKPDPSIFQSLISALNCHPDDILYIGDSIRLDMHPALTTGIDAVLIDRNGLYPFYRHPRINSLTELVNPPAS